MLKAGKQMITYLLMVGMLCLITGCGKPSSVADELGGLEDDSTEGESAAAFQKGALSDSLGMKDNKWEASFAIDGEDVQKVEILVDVQLPDTDHMNVADLELNHPSSDGMKELIGKLFDDGKAGVLDEEQYPKWKLEKLVEQYESLVAAWNESDSLEDWESQSKKEDEERLKKYQGQLTGASDEMVASTDYEENGYWGEVDGRVWELTKYKAGEDEYGIIAGLANEQDGLVTQIDTSSDGIYMYVGNTQDNVENACSISQEDAIRQAADFLSKLGYGEYEVKETKPIQWSMGWYDENREETFTEGYIVYFGRAVDGIQISTDSYTMPIAEGYVLHYYNDEEAWVRVTDAGVIGFDVQCPRTLKTDSVTETSLLSFDKIQDRIKECITRKAVEKSPNLRGNSMHVLELDHMDLTYMVLTGDEYTVIPVWRIYNYNVAGGNSDSIYDFILINAIDGSEIDWLSVYCRTLSDAEWEKEFGSGE